MKRYILTLIAALTIVASASAMSYQRAREEALYLTDKMAYELNLNDQQYNDAYEINLDYFMSMETESDLYAEYLNYRLTDFRHILLNWQFDLMLRADYFVRPIIWSHGCWVFPIYSHYHRHVFYYDCPRVYYEYRGGHGHHHYHHGFYADRRPRWDGGMRGREPMGHPGREGGRMNPRRDGGRVNPGRGNGYHFDLPGRSTQNPGVGTRNPGRVENGIERENRPGRNDNSMMPGREDRVNRGNSYNRTESGNYDRQTPVTRSENRTTTIPGRNFNQGSRSGSRSSAGSSNYDRGNSFSRSSSRAYSGSSSSSISRGGSVSRGSSGTQTRSGGSSSPSRGGTSGGGSVSRGRR